MYNADRAGFSEFQPTLTSLTRRFVALYFHFARFVTGGSKSYFEPFFPLDCSTIKQLALVMPIFVFCPQFCLSTERFPNISRVLPLWDPAVLLQIARLRHLDDFQSDDVVRHQRSSFASCLPLENLHNAGVVPVRDCSSTLAHCNLTPPSQRHPFDNWDNKADGFMRVNRVMLETSPTYVRTFFSHLKKFTAAVVSLTGCTCAFFLQCSC